MIDFLISSGSREKKSVGNLWLMRLRNTKDLQENVLKYKIIAITISRCAWPFVPTKQSQFDSRKDYVKKQRMQNNRSFAFSSSSNVIFSDKLLQFLIDTNRKRKERSMILFACQTSKVFQTILGFRSSTCDPGWVCYCADDSNLIPKVFLLMYSRVASFWQESVIRNLSNALPTSEFRRRWFTDLIWRDGRLFEVWLQSDEIPSDLWFKGSECLCLKGSEFLFGRLRWYFECFNPLTVLVISAVREGLRSDFRWDCTCTLSAISALVLEAEVGPKLVPKKFSRFFFRRAGRSWSLKLDSIASVVSLVLLDTKGDTSIFDEGDAGKSSNISDVGVAANHVRWGSIWNLTVGPIWRDAGIRLRSEKGVQSLDWSIDFEWERAARITPAWLGCGRVDPRLRQLPEDEVLWNDVPVRVLARWSSSSMDLQFSNLSKASRSFLTKHSGSSCVVGTFCHWLSKSMREAAGVNLT